MFLIGKLYDSNSRKEIQSFEIHLPTTDDNCEKVRRIDELEQTNRALREIMDRKSSEIVALNGMLSDGRVAAGDLKHRLAMCKELLEVNLAAAAAGAQRVGELEQANKTLVDLLANKRSEIDVLRRHLEEERIDASKLKAALGKICVESGKAASAVTVAG